MKVLIKIIASMMMSAAGVDSFVSPNYNHGMVKRIIDSTHNRYQQQVQQQVQQDNVLSPSVLCNSGAFGYCNSWG